MTLAGSDILYLWCMAVVTIACAIRYHRHALNEQRAEDFKRSWNATRMLLADLERAGLLKITDDGVDEVVRMQKTRQAQEEAEARSR